MENDEALSRAASSFRASSSFNSGAPGDLGPATQPYSGPNTSTPTWRARFWLEDKGVLPVTRDAEGKALSQHAEGSGVESTSAMGALARFRKVRACRGWPRGGDPSCVLRPRAPAS